VHSVYVVPMSQGMDQYLANRLAAEHIFQVVSDPKLADAFLTDRIGPALNSSLDEIAPPAKPAAPEAKDDAKDGKSNSDAKSASMTYTVANPALSSSFSHGKGTFFLVDTKSRQVLWSTFDVPKGAAVRELDRTASDIVSRLMRDMKKK